LALAISFFPSNTFKMTFLFLAYFNEKFKNRQDLLFCPLFILHRPTALPSAKSPHWSDKTSG